MWCNRDKLSRLQAQIGGSDPTDAVQPLVPSVVTSDGQQGEAKGTQESHATSFNPREKHLTSLSLGTFKESGAPDPSPSVTTTTTTHSLPAEAISPQSTEVDESLSMSFEQGSIAVSQREGDDSIQHSLTNGSHCVDTDFRVGMSLQLKKPPRSLGQGLEMGRPPGPGSLHLESEAHDVDLCLVSPCEFKHFKPTDSAPGAGDTRHAGTAAVGPQRHGNSQRDASLSESNAPHCTEDCPSTTADGGLDSDEDESCSEPTSSLHDHHTHQSLPADPPPAPLRDGPPPSPQPDSCMPVPQLDPQVHGKAAKTAGMRGGKKAKVSESCADFYCKTSTVKLSYCKNKYFVQQGGLRCCLNYVEKPDLRLSPLCGYTSIPFIPSFHVCEKVWPCNLWHKALLLLAAAIQTN